MKAAVYTLPAYEKQANRLLSPAEKTALEDHIAEAPEAHPIVPGTGGVRKARWGRGGKGKSGGVRAIYYFHIGQYSVYMLTLYAKSEQTDLTEGDKRDMKQILSRLKGRARA
ncbi:MAG: type II toxin-antitoxin system RelE/ParE family toxin [Acidobacteriota bacterium]